MRVVVLQGFHDSKFCLSISPGQVDFSAEQTENTVRHTTFGSTGV